MNISFVAFDILSLLVVSFLGACAPGVYPVGGGMGFINLGTPDQTPLIAWYNAPSGKQVEYVYRIIDALNSTGLRCPRRGITVGEIRYEILTRINRGEALAQDPLLDHVVKILRENGCGSA